MYKTINELEYIIFGFFAPKKSDKKQQQNMPELETEQKAAERQQGQGLKILAPKQMITRMRILLAQLRAGNNSEKLKNEIKKIVHSLYRSKNLSKTIYNNLMNKH